MRVAEYAFHYAKANGRQRVSAIHKANIMRKTDSLFGKCCIEVAEKYPEIEYEEVIIDNYCMMLVKNPAFFFISADVFACKKFILFALVFLKITNLNYHFNVFLFHFVLYYSFVSFTEN